MPHCGWAKTDLSIPYHDLEWGVPAFDDNTLFEFLILEGAQAGLSWETILKKRDAYREAYEGFDPHRVARFSSAKAAKLLKNPGLVRNRLKIDSSISNAKAALKLQDEFGSLAAHLWSFVDPQLASRPIINSFKTLQHIPPNTPISDAMSKDLKKRGFRFVGSTICYAFMQAVGMVNDHLTTCPRHAAICKLAASSTPRKSSS